MKAVLEADGIQLRFGERTILSDIYFRCETGEVTGLLGRNGEGKSCLLRAVYGTLSCERSVRVDGRPFLQGFKRPDLLAYLPQHPFIPRSLRLGRIFRDFGVDPEGFVSRFPEFRQRMAHSLSSLSGGERRMAELYLIVQGKARFVLLDEPFTHLNPLQIEKALGLIAEASASKGIVVTDHLFRHVLQLSHRLYLLRDGRCHSCRSEGDLARLGYVRGVGG